MSTSIESALIEALEKNLKFLEQRERYARQYHENTLRQLEFEYKKSEKAQDTETLDRLKNFMEADFKLLMIDIEQERLSVEREILKAKIKSLSPSTTIPQSPILSPSHPNVRCCIGAIEELEPIPIGDTTCSYNAQSSHLRCAINPTGPCEGCQYYEQN